MALTNEDLQAFTQILDTKFDERLQPISDRLGRVETQVKATSDRLGNVETQIKATSDRMDNLQSQIKQTEHVLRNEIHKESSLVLDEVERVHHILNKHIADVTKHTA